MTVPRTSVLMAARDAGETVREAATSALAQSVTDIELIIVDDGSDEPVASVLSDIRDPRLVIVRHDRGLGLSAARNAALALARAPLVSQLDADDAWEHDYVESILPCFEDPAVALAYTNAAVIDDPAGVYVYHASPQPAHPVDRFPEIAMQNPIAASTATMRTDAVRAAGGYAPWLWGGQDYHLYLKLVSAGWRFAYIDRALVRYRAPVTAKSMTYHQQRVDRSDVKLWLGFLLRHPTARVPRRHLGALLLRKGVRSAPLIWRLRRPRTALR